MFPIWLLFNVTMLIEKKVCQVVLRSIMWAVLLPLLLGSESADGGLAFPWIIHSSITADQQGFPVLSRCSEWSAGTLLILISLSFCSLLDANESVCHSDGFQRCLSRKLCADVQVVADFIQLLDASCVLPSNKYFGCLPLEFVLKKMTNVSGDHKAKEALSCSAG